jgi:uncharacterized protein YuzE
MKIKLDLEDDALYIRFKEDKILESEELKRGIIFDYNRKGEVVGVEIINISKYIPKDKLKNLELETV